MLCFLSQILMQIVLVPGVIYTSKNGFKELYVLRSLVEIEFIIVKLVITSIMFRITPYKIFINIWQPLIVSVGLYLCLVFMNHVSDNIPYKIVITGLAFISYFLIILQLKDNRKVIFQYIKEK